MPERMNEGRLRSGLTLGEVAGILRVSPQELAAWERGEAEPMTSQLRDLSRLYGCSPDWLLGLAEERTTAIA